MFRVTNDEFLSACFGEDKALAHVCGFDEDPATLEGEGKKHYWAGNKWGRFGASARARLPEQNAYFTISVFRDDETGKARRRKALFESTHVVVIDDVGTKVDAAVLSGLPGPSWVLETSPGNFQWGYILDEPETDAGRVNALLDGLVAKGLCVDGKDPGMKGVTRYVRLPEGRNSKAKYGDGGFACGLTSWAPERRVSMDDLARPFGIELPAPGSVSGTPGRIAVDVNGDELLALLSEWGMVTGERAADGEGFVCECPWVDYHTERADSGSAYWLGGAFKCHHGHCQDKGRRDLERWAHERLGVESGGLAGLSAWNFAPVPGYVPPWKPSGERIEPVDVPAKGMPAEIAVDYGTGPGGEFFAEHIFIAPEDRFLSVRTGELLTRSAVDTSWFARLAGAGALPPVGKTGELMSPSRWFAAVDNAPRARVADRITYWPGAGSFFRDGGVAFANQWRAPERLGFGAEDADVEPWLRLVRHVVGGEGAEAVEWVLDWMALVVGSPETKPGFHLVVQGGQGLGKDMMIQPVVVGVGEDNKGTVNAGALGGQFNSWAERRLIVVNELKQNSRGSATGADQYTVLKELTENTNARVKINQKNMREYYARNVGAFYVTSNDERAVALEADDRRFLVVMAEAQPWDGAEYASLARWMTERGGAELCAEWMHERWERMGRERRDALLGRAPMTAGKARMILNTQDPFVGWMREQIEDGIWPVLMTSQDITGAITAGWKSGSGGFNFMPSSQKWGSVLRLVGGGKVYGGEPVRLKSGLRARMWATRDLKLWADAGADWLAQSYISKAGHAFRENADGDVIPMTPTT